MSEDIIDREFVIYSDRNVYLGGRIKNGQLQLESEVYGEDYDSEQHIDFSDEDTKRLFSLMSFQEFMVFMKEQHLLGLNALLKENGIEPKTTTI